MEQRDYQAFEHLSGTLHFGRSARVLGMSASALTRRVQGIEEELGQALLLRDNKQVHLTKAGEIFRRFCRSQLEQFEELQNELKEEQESPSGELLVACTVTACHTLLPAVLARLRVEYPGITLRLITQDAARSLRELEAGEVDLAVIPTEPGKKLSGIDSKVLGETTLSFIAPLDDPAIELALTSCPPALGDLPFVLPTGGLERARLNEFLKDQGVTPRSVAEVRGNEGIIAMVSLGSGIALVPELVLASSPLSSGVRRVPELQAPRGYQVSLCARRRSLSRRVVRAFWDVASLASA